MRRLGGTGNWRKKKAKALQAKSSLVIKNMKPSRHTSENGGQFFGGLFPELSKAHDTPLIFLCVSYFLLPRFKFVT